MHGPHLPKSQGHSGSSGRDDGSSSHALPPSSIPSLATAGTSACRDGSGVHLMTPFAGVSVSSHRLASVSLCHLPPRSISLLHPHERTCRDPGAVSSWVRQREQSCERRWKGRGQNEASSGERGRERLGLSGNEGEAV